MKMDPLALVEEQLSSVDIWPSGDLTVMFSGDEPNVRVIRRFGNGVSAIDAVKLCMTCQGPHDRWRKMAETQMYGWYMQWAKCGNRNIFYYNMKKCVLLGREKHVEPEVTVLNFGPTHSPRPMGMRQRIQGFRFYGNILIRSVE